MVASYIQIQKMAGRNISRVDTSALKFQIERKLGHERSQKYFNLLSRYFNKKINKSEFDKLCFSLIGRENLRLHNLLIQSIVTNASVAKTPPPKERESNIKAPKVNLETLCRQKFPRSPRKGRTRINRKLKDRLSPLGPHAKTSIITYEDSVSIPKPQEQQSATSLLSLGSKPPRSVEDGEEVEQASRSPVRAPFGVSINGKVPRKVLISSPMGSCISNGVLPDTASLSTQLGTKLESEGLKISSDCVSLLNRGLDVYLKRLIAPCVQLAGAREGLRLDRYVRKLYRPDSASLLDFRAAMEMNPKMLGVDWSEQVEKMCMRVSDQ